MWPHLLILVSVLFLLDFLKFLNVRGEGDSGFSLREKPLPSPVSPITALVPSLQNVEVQLKKKKLNMNHLFYSPFTFQMRKLTDLRINE